MISDTQLYGLAVFLGSAAMLLIIIYHYLEVNSNDKSMSDIANEKKKNEKIKQ